MPLILKKLLTSLEYINAEILRGVNLISHICCISAYSDLAALNILVYFGFTSLPLQLLSDCLLNNGCRIQVAGTVDKWTTLG